MTSRLARFAPLAFAAALAFSVLALIFVTLNGKDLGSATATGSVILAVSFSAAGAVIVVLRPDNPVGWIFLLGGFCNSLNAFSWDYARYALITEPSGRWPLGSFFSWLSTWIFAPGFVCSFPLTLLLFPTGRPPSPRWWPLLWLALAGLALAILPMAVASWPPRGPALVTGNLWETGVVGGPAVTLQLAGVGTIIVCILLSVVSVGVRFRRAVGEERQQLKWLVYAGAVAFVVTITASPAAPVKLPGLLGEALSILAFFALPGIPVAVGIAILRYRLYDIDRVINRTLVYGALTVSLALVYIGSVVVLRGLIFGFTGQSSQLTVVASTLAVAALFNPLRRRIQNFIDRRFYRRKYDAERALAVFGERLREDAELGQLTLDLRSVIRETVQPEHVTVWLRPPDEGDGR